MATPRLLDTVRARLLAAPDTLCLERARLVTEAWREHATEPPPVRRALAFAHVLRHMTLDVDSNPYFAGNTSSRPRGWMLVPEHGFGADAQVLLEHDGLDGLIDGVPDDLREFWRGRGFGGTCGVGHLAVDLERVVHGGLSEVLRRVEAVHEADDVDARCYRRAMAIALRAVVAWAGRFADAAEAAADRAPAELAPLHRRVAAACRRVPAEGARNLFEALQAIALVHLAIAVEGHGMSVSVGLPDRLLEPFIGHDFDAGAATELIAAFLLKLTAHSLFGRGSKTQAITVGGRDPHGRDRSNALTRCFLDAADLVRVGDPHVFLRWHPGIDEALEARALELLAGGFSQPLLISDGPTVQGLVEAGISAEAAAGYCVIGCNELGVPGQAMSTAFAGAGTIRPIELLREAVLEGAAPGDVLPAYERVLRRRAVEARRAGRAHWRRASELVPTPFTSALMHGCIESGRDLLVGMPYRQPCLYERGMADAVNALAAIEHVVIGGAATMEELQAGLRDDFADDGLRRKLLAAPKWGNDDPAVDRWAAELVAIRGRVLDEVDAAEGDPPHLVCHVVRSLHRLDGSRLPATPDGRRAGEPLCDSLGAKTGTAVRGPAALLNSVATIAAARWYKGGTNLNLTLGGGSATPRVVRALVRGFFEQGGQELQIARLDAGVLRAAQTDPAAHGDLVVRVAGFCARFVDLSRAEQEELIRRAEAAAGL